MAESPYKVLLISGAGRSGSTLLDQVLGQVDGFFSVGELNYFWDAGLGRNQLCSCGKKLRECPFWNAVVTQTLKNANQTEIDYIINLKQSVSGRKFMLQLANKWVRSPQFQKKLTQYAQLSKSLYNSIHEISGAKVIVDSSKDPAHILLLREMKVDYFVIHLVRDSRAVAFSRQRKKRKTAIWWTEEYMPIEHPLKTAFKWSVVNALVEHVGKKEATRYMRLSYEAFVTNPEIFIQKIITFISENTPNLDFVHNQNVLLNKESHIALGNPNKSTQKHLSLQLDNVWLENMHPIHRNMVTAVTAPLLWRYGYRLSKHNAYSKNERK